MRARALAPPLLILSRKTNPKEDYMNLPSLFRRNGNDPLRSLARIRDNLDNMMQEFTDADSSFFRSDFSPSCELSEDKSNFYAKFDIPGVKKEDVKVEMDGGQLTVSAERREEKRNEDKKNFYSEISYGSFERSFTLPAAVDEKKIEATFDNGVLTLVMPKNGRSTAKQIEVH